MIAEIVLSDWITISKEGLVRDARDDMVLIIRRRYP